jgi:hypothetical protein
MRLFEAIGIANTLYSIVNAMAIARELVVERMTCVGLLSNDCGSSSEINLELICRGGVKSTEEYSLNNSVAMLQISAHRQHEELITSSLEDTDCNDAA